MAADLTFAPATDEDAVDLAAHMRALDLAEITAASGGDALAIVRAALAASPEPIAVRSADRLLCIFGTVPLDLLRGIGSPWMLGTDLLERHPRTLSRVGRRYMSEMLRTYSLLVNYVDARNAPAIRLLRWLGCTLGDPEPYGVARLPFHRFELRGA